MSLAMLGYVGYGTETTEGTLVAPTIFLPVTSFNFDDTNEYITPDQIRGTRDRSIALAGPYSTSGTVEMELVPNGIAALLKSAFAAQGANTVSAYTGASSAYTHTFTPGNNSPYFTFEANAADILIRRYGGIRVNTLEVNAAFGEIVTASFGLEGTTRGTTALPGASETFSQVTPFHFDGAYIQMDTGSGFADIATVKSFTFGVNNNIDRMGTLRRTKAYRRTVLGMRDVTLSMALDFDSPDDYTRFLNETEFKVKLVMEGGYVSGSSGTKNSLVITINRVKYNTTSIPISGADFIEQSVECLILAPLDGVTPIFEAVLTNNESSVPGA